MRDGQVKYVLSARLYATAFSTILQQQSVSPGGVVTLARSATPKIIARTRNEDRYIGAAGDAGFRRARHARQRKAAGGRCLLEGTPAYSAWSRSRLTGWTIGIGVPAEADRRPDRRSFTALLGGRPGDVRRRAGAGAAARPRHRPRPDQRRRRGAGAGARRESGAASSRASPKRTTSPKACARRRRSSSSGCASATRRRPKPTATAPRCSSARNRRGAPPSRSTAPRTSSSPPSRTSCARRSTRSSAGSRCCAPARSTGAPGARARRDRAQHPRAGAARRGPARHVARHPGQACGSAWSRCDLAVVLDAAIESLKPTADARQIAIHGARRARRRLRLRRSRPRLQQVVWNLLSNALKFTPPGGRIDARVEVAEGSDAVVRISDSGEGIAPEFLPHVFDRFRQENAAVTRTHSGPRPRALAGAPPGRAARRRHRRRERRQGTGRDLHRPAAAARRRRARRPRREPGRARRRT